MRRRNHGRKIGKGQKKQAKDPLWLTDIKDQWQRDRESQVSTSPSSASAGPAEPASSPSGSTGRSRRGSRLRNRSDGSQSSGSSSGDLSFDEATSASSNSRKSRRRTRRGNPFLALLRAGSTAEGDFFGRLLGNARSTPQAPGRTNSEDKDELEQLYGEEEDEETQLRTAISNGETEGNAQMRDHISKFIQSQIDKKGAEIEREEGEGEVVGSESGSGASGSGASSSSVTATSSSSSSGSGSASCEFGAGLMGPGSGSGGYYRTLRKATIRDNPFGPGPSSSSSDPDNLSLGSSSSTSSSSSPKLAAALLSSGSGSGTKPTSLPTSTNHTSTSTPTRSPSPSPSSSHLRQPTYTKYVFASQDSRDQSVQSDSMIDSTLSSSVTGGGGGGTFDAAFTASRSGTAKNPYMTSNGIYRPGGISGDGGSGGTGGDDSEDGNSGLRTEMRKKKLGLFRPLSSFLSRVTKKKKKNHLHNQKQNRFRARATAGPQLRKQLKTFATSLRRSDSTISSLERKMTDLERSVSHQLVNLRRRAGFDLIRVYRPFMIHKLLRLGARREFEEACRVVVDRRKRFTEHAMRVMIEGSNPLHHAISNSNSSSSSNSNLNDGDSDHTDNDPTPGYVCSRFFEEIEEVVVGDPKLVFLWRRVGVLEEQEKLLEKKYEFRRRTSSKLRTSSQIETSLKHFLPQVECVYGETEWDERVWQDDVDDLFATILGDERTGIGQSIVGFVSEIHLHGLEKILPKEYLAYIDSVVDCLCTAYQIFDKPDIRRLRVLTDRFIFHMIGRELLKIEEEREREQDEAFNDNLRLLRHLSPSQVGIRACYLHPTKMRYSFLEAVDLLRNIPYCIDPNVMMHAVRCACSSIGTEAKKNCERNGVEWSFGADDFFPILIYCIVRANEASFPSHMAYVSKYASLYKREEHSSEATYFLTVMSGATNYVASMTMDQLLMLLKEKNDRMKLRDYSYGHMTDSNWEEAEGWVIDAMGHVSTALEELRIDERELLSFDDVVDDDDNEEATKDENDDGGDEEERQIEEYRQRLLEQFAEERRAREAELVGYDVPAELPTEEERRAREEAELTSLAKLIVEVEEVTEEEETEGEGETVGETVAEDDESTREEEEEGESTLNETEGD